MDFQFIFLALFIPVFTSIILWFWFKHKTVWWEFLIPFIASIITILIFKFTAEWSRTRDIEYWGGILTKTEYYEDWNEYIHQTCTCCCDKDGNNCTTYDCSYVSYHSEYWKITGSNCENIRISKQQYELLVKKFNNEVFVDLHRGYYTNDGDKYVSTWDKNKETLEPIITVHSYENRVQVSNSVFNYPEVKENDIKQYKLYEYPEIYDYYKQKCILGIGDSTQILAERKFQILNSRLGLKKQVKVFILIFNNLPIKSAELQESYWKGGNKNEFIVCIGIDKNMNVKWCKPFSWTEVAELKIRTRNFVEKQDKLNLNELSDFLYKELDDNFIRKQFKEFSYLSVEPTTEQTIAAFIITLVVNIICSFIVIRNDITEIN